MILREVEGSVAAPASRDRIERVEIFQTRANSSGLTQMVGSATVYRRTGSTTCTFVDGSSLTVPYSRTADGFPESDRCNVLGGCGAATRRSTTSAVRVTYTHTYVTPLDNLVGGDGTLTFDRTERHADGAGAVKRRQVVRRSERGQGLVEFAMLVPVFMVLLLGLLEFGFVFDHGMTINYATREGARSGAAFAQGNGTIDGLRRRRQEHHRRRPARPRTHPARWSHRATSRRSPSSSPHRRHAGIAARSNIWTYSAGGGPRSMAEPGLPPRRGPVERLHRPGQRRASAQWDQPGLASACASPTRYHYVTPLAAAIGFFGPSTGSGILTIHRPDGHGPQPA